LLVSLLLVVEREEEGFKVEVREVGRLGIHRNRRILLLQPNSNGLLRVVHFLVPRFGLVLI